MKRSTPPGAAAPRDPRTARNRNRFKHLNTLAAALAARLRVKDAILDGEITCADETGSPIFIGMLRRRHAVCFVAFDLLWLNGEDWRELPLVRAQGAAQASIAAPLQSPNSRSGGRRRARADTHGRRRENTIAKASLPSERAIRTTAASTGGGLRTLRIRRRKGATSCSTTAPAVL
jgi:hypothetical protein